MGGTGPSIPFLERWWRHGYRWMVPITSTAWDASEPSTFRRMQIAGWQSSFRATWRKAESAEQSYAKY